jgi:multisubunit Na+/H+ antiporter MnhE subunit
MSNIFNFGLFLLLIWLILTYFVKGISLFYIFFGVFISFFISFCAFKLNFFNKNSKMLFLHLSFYFHFLQILLKNFFSCFDLIFSIIFNSSKLKPLVYMVKIDEDGGIDKAVLIASINLSLGLSLLENKDDLFIIHALSEKYWQDFNLTKMLKALPEIDESDIV